MSHRRIDQPRPDATRRATRRRASIEALESRQLMTSQVLVEYPISQPASAPAKIALVSDGSLWFTEDAARPTGDINNPQAAKLGRVTTAGVLTEPATLLPNDGTYGITFAQGSVWATEQGATPGIAQVDPGLDVNGNATSVTQYTNFAPVPGVTDPVHNLNAITKGPVGDNTYLWFTDSGTNSIGRIAINGGTAQAIQEFPLPTGVLVGTNITAGPNGDDGLYFVETSSFGTQNFIGRIDPNGNFTNSLVTNTAGLTPGTPSQIAMGPDGALYFTETNTSRIGRIVLSGGGIGSVNDDFFAIPNVTDSGGTTPVTVGPDSIATFPDGSLYFTEVNVGSLGRITINAGGNLTGFFQYPSFPTVSGLLPGITSDLTGDPWFTETSTNRIGTFKVASDPLQAQPTTINGTVNQPLNNVPIATFSDPDGPDMSTQFTATINWGDGTPTDSNTTFSPTGTSSSSFTVFGSHTYAVAGKYTPTVTITDLASPRTATVFDTANITGVVIPPGNPGNIVAVAGTPFLGVNGAGAAEPVATFPATTTSGYQAFVDFGDGTALGGATITGPTLINGVLTDSVVATHTFAKNGVYNGSVQLRNPDGSLTVFALTSTVGGLTPESLIDGIEDGTAGTPYPIGDIAALFTPTGSPSPDPAYYDATIDFGDGSTPVSASVTSDPAINGLAINFPSHTYAQPGNYQIRYTLGDAGAPSLATGTLALGVVALVPATTPAIQALAGTAIPPGVLASVFPARGNLLGNQAPDAVNYSATVDFGDGTGAQAATIINNNGGLQISTSGHTYEDPGTYTITYLLSDAGAKNLVTGTVQADVSGFVRSGQPAVLSTVAGVAIPSVFGISFTPASGQNLAANGANYSLSIDYGDGTALGQGHATVNGGLLSFFNLTHTYATPGSYTITYTLSDAGAPTLAVATQGITITTPSATTNPITGISGQPINGGNQVTLAIVSGSPAILPTGYSATIDYGDGSPTSTGFITQTGGQDTLTISGPTHVYAAAGTYPVTILLGDPANPNLAIFHTTATILPAAISITGALNPLSDSGISDTDAITNVKTPNFFGVTAPGASVVIQAYVPGYGVIPVGHGVADSSGNYSINTIPLADGSYQIDAMATAPGGGNSAVLIEDSNHPLVIDTVGPKVTNFAVTSTYTGQFQATFADDRSGLVSSQLADGNNYSVSRTYPAVRPFQSFLVSSLTEVGGGPAGSPITVTGSVFNGHYLTLRGGLFVFDISSAGITDVAGNHLDGEFYGNFPSGNSVPGGDFVAKVLITGYKAGIPTPVSTANPGQPGTATISPTLLAPKLARKGLNAPPVVTVKITAKTAKPVPTKMHKA